MGDRHRPGHLRTMTRANNAILLRAHETNALPQPSPIGPTGYDRRCQGIERFFTLEPVTSLTGYSIQRSCGYRDVGRA